MSKKWDVKTSSKENMKTDLYISQKNAKEYDHNNYQAY